VVDRLDVLAEGDPCGPSDQGHHCLKEPKRECNAECVLGPKLLDHDPVGHGYSQGIHAQADSYAYDY
jgi:hypothetical protein